MSVIDRQCTNPATITVQCSADTYDTFHTCAEHLEVFGCAVAQWEYEGDETCCFAGWLVED
jgi:hypothetical protein